jgi:hypothetical protein
MKTAGQGMGVRPSSARTPGPAISIIVTLSFPLGVSIEVSIGCVSQETTIAMIR